MSVPAPFMVDHLCSCTISCIRSASYIIISICPCLFYTSRPNRRFYKQEGMQRLLAAIQEPPFCSLSWTCWIPSHLLRNLACWAWFRQDFPYWEASNARGPKYHTKTRWVTIYKVGQDPTVNGIQKGSMLFCLLHFHCLLSSSGFHTIYARNNRVTRVSSYWSHGFRSLAHTWTRHNIGGSFPKIACLLEENLQPMG